uniref:Uncharacterized protein n=1 Tax=Cacopsylla melanoneura TaxID=428564 RepID=A0A8D8T074_9HEMI
MKEEGVRQRRRLIRKEDYHMFVLCYFSVSIFHSFSLTLSHLPASCLFSFLVFLSFLSLPPILSISYLSTVPVFSSLSLPSSSFPIHCPCLLPLSPSHPLLSSLPLSHTHISRISLTLTCLLCSLSLSLS